uniref:V-type proton ATPase 16 kDa proteolipid subunit c-like n=1 Tax=Callithrix jacchus TaxID=9483 RepID=UPI00159E8069|nr:V-type proton ATPase 16 kDa proteolipid subunit c-like [Callithrix jacchus]
MDYLDGRNVIHADHLRAPPVLAPGSPRPAELVPSPPSDVSDCKNGPEYASLFAISGASAAMVFISALGAAYDTAKGGTGIAAMCVLRLELILKPLIPVVAAGSVAIYGLVVTVIANSLNDDASLYRSFLPPGADRSPGWSSGFAIRIVGGTARQPRHFGGVIPILIFAEELGLYDLIVAFLLCRVAPLGDHPS